MSEGVGGVVGTSRVDSISGLRVVRFCAGLSDIELVGWVEWLRGL